MRIVDQKNFASGILYLIIGGVVAIGAARYRIGTPDAMGPGYFPVAVGVALALTGVWVLLGSLARGASASRLGAWPVRALVIVLAAILGFAAVLRVGGLIVAVPFLLVVAALAHPGFSWRQALVSVAVLLPLTWALFIVLLGLQIPFLPPAMGAGGG